MHAARRLCIERVYSRRRFTFRARGGIERW